MGAYENPKFFNAPNYMAGTQAFLTTFKKGFEEEFQKGQDLIEDRKAYEDGIYEQGEELKKELDAAVNNSQITKDQVQTALRSFYDEALSVDMPTKKGLGGLFAKPTERRLGKLDLIEAQNSFTDAITGINTAFNYAYDPEVDIMENEDRGHPQFKKKKAIYDAIKNASANPNFNYSDGKFDGSLEVIIDGKKQKFTTGEIQAIFSASGKEQRDIIDAKHTEMEDGVFNALNAELSNSVEYSKFQAGDKNKMFFARNAASRILDARLGIAGSNANYSKATLSFLNDEYNNHANINENQKIDIIGQYVTNKKINKLELARIANEPMDVSAGTYAQRYDISIVEATELKQQILQGKTDVVKSSYMQALADRGLIDKAYIAPLATGDGDGGNGISNSVNLAYANIRDTVNIDYGKMNFSEIQSYWKGRTFKDARILDVRRAVGPTYKPGDNNLIFTVTSGQTGEEDLPVINMNSVEGRNFLTRELIDASQYGGKFRDDLQVLAEQDYFKEKRRFAFQPSLGATSAGTQPNDFSNTTLSLYNTLYDKYGPK